MQVRKSKSIGKRIVAVFFIEGGILTTVLLEKSKTATAKWYTETCLPQLFEKLVSRASLDSCFLYHNNAPAHRAFATQEFLEGIKVQLLEHPAYSPEIAPCDFGLFSDIKLRMKGRHFSSGEELIAAFQEECDLIPKQMWEEWYDEWFRRMEKCIDCDGKYFERLKVEHVRQKLWDYNYSFYLLHYFMF